jgi:hypothetical protein
MIKDGVRVDVAFTEHIALFEGRPAITRLLLQ